MFAFLLANQQVACISMASRPSTKRTQKPSNNGVENQREAILTVAEQLFGQKGYEGVSLREISAASGSANHSAVNYYFTNKDGLVDAIIAERAKNIDARREQRLTQLRATGRVTDVKSILEALLLPIAEEKNASGNCSYAAFLLALRVFSDITHWRELNDSPAIARQLIKLLHGSLKPLPSKLVDSRFLLAFTFFLVAVVDWDQSKVLSQSSFKSREAYLQNCINFAAAGMTAAR